MYHMAKLKKLRPKSYRDYVREARERAGKNCPHKHFVIICSGCGKIVGSEVDKKWKGIISHATDYAVDL